MKKIFEAFAKNEFWKSVAVLASGNISAQLINVISIPLMSRIYSPEAFGEYAIITSWVAILSIVTALGLSSAIMSPKDDIAAKRLFTVAAVINVAGLALLIVGFLIVSPFFPLVVISIHYIWAGLALFLLTLSANMCNNLRVYVNRMGNNKILFWNPVIGALCTLLITLPLGLLHFGVNGFILGILIGSLIQFLHMATKVSPFFRGIHLSEYRNELRSYKEYIRFQWPSNILTTGAAQLPNQALNRIFGNTALGHYAMMTKILAYPLNLIASPISNVYFRTATQYKRENKPLGDFTFSFVLKFMLIGFVPAAIAMCFGSELFVFVLGSQWGEAGSIASTFTLQYVFLFCNTCLSYCRVVNGNQRLNFGMAWAQFIVVIVAIVVGYFWFRTVSGTLLCFTIISTIFQVIDITVNFICLKKNAVKFFCLAVVYSAILLSVVWLKNILL